MRLWCRLLTRFIDYLSEKTKVYTKHASVLLLDGQRRRHARFHHDSGVSLEVLQDGKTDPLIVRGLLLPREDEAASLRQLPGRFCIQAVDFSQEFSEENGETVSSQTLCDHLPRLRSFYPLLLSDNDLLTIYPVHSNPLQSTCSVRYNKHTRARVCTWSSWYILHKYVHTQVHMKLFIY